MYLCANIDKIITGKLNKNAPAHIGPRSRLYADRKPARPTVNVLAFILVSNRENKKKDNRRDEYQNQANVQIRRTPSDSENSKSNAASEACYTSKGRKEGRGKGNYTSGKNEPSANWQIRMKMQPSVIVKKII